MKRFLVLCLALSLISTVSVGCENKAKVEKKTTISTPREKRLRQTVEPLKLLARIRQLLRWSTRMEAV